jgi:hypothetical protein
MCCTVQRLGDAMLQFLAVVQGVSLGAVSRSQGGMRA